MVHPIFSVQPFRFIPFLFLFLLACNESENSEVAIKEIKPSPPIGEVYSKEAKKIHDYFENRFKKNLFSGTILFAENGRVIYNKAFGFENTVRKTKLSTCSSFQLASVTKPITALAILLLKDQNRLKYENEVTDYFPNFPYKGISIKHLLSHRSGLPNYMYFSEELWQNKEIPIRNEDVIDLLIKHKPAPYHRPDYRYNYSNTGYSILASIIEKITEMTYEQFVQENIFSPIQMTNSFVYRKGNGQLEMCKVKGYNGNNTEADNSYLNGVVGDKGVYSTVEDLFKLDQALYEGTLISDKTLEEAFRPQHKDLKQDDNYGLGWRVRNYKNGDQIIYHSGWWKGFRTYFIRDIKRKKTIIVLNNSNKGSFLKVDELRSLF